MSKKYVATIMKRVFLGDDNFIFYVSHPAIGDFNKDNGIFMDRNGNEFLSITDPTQLISEVDTAFANLEDLSTMREKFGKHLSTQEAISEYNYICSRYIHYVSKTNRGEVFYVPFDLEDMKDRLNASLEYIEEMGGFEAASKNLQENNAIVDGSEVPNISSALLSKEFRAELSSLVMEMMDGVYSLDELKEIKDALETQRDDIDSVIDSLDLQIEATEAGESSNVLKGEEVVEPVNKALAVVEPPRKVKLPLKNYINLDNLFKNVTKTLIAQDEPTRRVITEIARKEHNPSSKNRALLITGPTGCGKTKMMQLISKYMDRFFYKVDSTQLTIPGYVGKDIEELLWDMYIECGRDKDKCEHAIIFFDEIDKKGSSKKEDVSGKGVLNVLLPFIEGSTYDATADLKKHGEIVKINTSNMIVILGGAFTDVYKNLKENNSIGFGADVTKSTTSRVAQTEDFVEKAKMPDEFMGRVSIIKLNDLDEDAIKRIILESDESAVEVQKKIFDELGVKLTFGDDFIDELAKRTVKRQTGARGLNTIVDETTWEAYADCYTHLGQIDEIILEKETIDDPKVYKKINKKR